MCLKKLISGGLTRVSFVTALSALGWGIDMLVPVRACPNSGCRIKVCGVTKGLFIEVRAGVKNRHGILLEPLNWPNSLASSKQLSQRRAESDGSD